VFISQIARLDCSYRRTFGPVPASGDWYNEDDAVAKESF